MVIRLRNNHFSGGKVGIKTSGPVQLDIEGNTFENVEQPYDIANASNVRIKGTRIKDNPRLEERRGKSSVGWRKSNGPPLPVFCPQCKSIFPSKKYNLSGAYFHAWDNEEPCEECGFEHGQLSEGIFDLTSEVVRVLSAPDITHAMLVALNQVADDVVGGRTTPEDGIEKFAAVSPKLGALARKALAIGSSTLLLLAAVSGIAANYFAHRQVELAREQLHLQKTEGNSTEKALREVLTAIGTMKFKLDGGYRTDEEQSRERSRTVPSQNKAASKSCASKPKHQRKQKARQLRHEVEARRRREFGGARR